MASPSQFLPRFLLDDCIGGADGGEDEEEGTQHKLGVVQAFCLKMRIIMVIIVIKVMLVLMSVVMKIALSKNLG